MADHNDEWTPAVSKPGHTASNELAADALSLVRRNDSHRPERRAFDGTDSDRAEHDVAYDRLVGDRDQRQQGGPSLPKRIDYSPLVFLIERLAIHIADGADITGSLVPDLDWHVHPPILFRQQC